MKMTTLATTALAALFASATCAAQITPTNPPVTHDESSAPTRGKAMTSDASWDEKDANKDGYITKEELKGDPALLTHFDAIDSDHDMKISPSEWKAWGHNNDKK
jgi:hypothetical protein